MLIFSTDFVFCYIVALISNTKYFGRTKTVILLLLLSFICYMILIFFEDNMKQTMYSVTLVLSRLCFSGFFCIQHFLSSEIYPTVLRAKGLGYNNVFNKLGAMIAPLLIENLVSFLSTFAFLNFISVFFAFLLPETYGRPLLNQVPEDSMAFDDSVSGIEKD